MRPRIISSLDDIIAASEPWAEDLELLARCGEEAVIKLSPAMAITLRALALKLRREELIAEVDRLAAFEHEHGNSDDDGRCRHGVYVGGSGADYMCGYCEQMDALTERDELRARAAELGAALQPEHLTRGGVR